MYASMVVAIAKIGLECLSVPKPLPTFESVVKEQQLKCSTNTKGSLDEVEADEKQLRTMTHVAWVNFQRKIIQQPQKPDFGTN